MTTYRDCIGMQVQGGVRRELIQQLIEITESVRALEQEFRSLGESSPSAALQLLIASEPILKSKWGENLIQLLLGAIAQPVLTSKDQDLAPHIVNLLELYSDRLKPEGIKDFLFSVPPQQRGKGFEEVLFTALSKHPRHIGFLRLASEFAVVKQDIRQTNHLLKRLACEDPSPATINHIWRLRQTLPRPETASVRIGLLSSFTIEVIVPYLDLELRDLGIEPSFYIAPFNSWAQELIAQDSGLKKFQTDINFLSVSIDDLIPELSSNLSPKELETRGCAVVDRLLTVLHHYAASSNTPIVVHNFYSIHPDPLSVSRADHSMQSRSVWIHKLNERLIQGLENFPQVYVLDIADLLLRRAAGALDNPKMRHLAAIRLFDGLLREIARAYANYIAPLKGLTRKCIVVDLDNTLWGGVVGEDGPYGIALGNTSPGSEFKEFQRYLKGLTERGFLLAINSKNNAEDALSVIREHKDMVLREEDFSAIYVNWSPKHENMLSIAQELNIGIDSMVFIDDNPNERELMRQLLPQVLVPELPSDPALYRKTLENLPQLQVLLITDEDLSRVEQYRARHKRKIAEQAAGSLEDYLNSLGLTAEIAQATEAVLPRIHQLFQRTNQFNLTARRYDLGQLSAYAQDPNWRLYTMRVKDRFGDHGLVATALVHAEKNPWIIDSFLMSCRIIGYGAETALLASIANEARDRGITELMGEYIETKKNIPARDFYKKHRFTLKETLDGVARWQLELNDGIVEQPHWIKVEIYGA